MNPLRFLLVLAASWLLGFRIAIAHACWIMRITNPEIIYYDLLIWPFVGLVILLNLKYRPTRRELIYLLISGILVAAFSFLLTEGIYAAVIG